MALPPRASRLLGYWRAERRTLRQGLVALALSTVAGFVAGLTLAHITGTLESLPGLIVLIPAAVGMRGTIFGAIGARLGTTRAAGLLEPTLRRGGILNRNAKVSVLTTLSSSLWLAGLAKLASAAFGQPSISIWSLATISVVGGLLGSALILVVTLVLALLSHRLGWDLDSVATPMVTALGDMVTLPTLFLATILVREPIVGAVAAGACVAAGVLAAARSYTTPDRVVRRIAFEMTGVIALTPILDVLAGGLLRAREPQLLDAPILLSVIPPFVSQAGALGGIFASRITSKLQIGLIAPRRRPEPPAVLDAAVVLAFGLIVFTLIGLIALGLSDVTGLGHPSIARVVGGIVLAGMMATPVALVVGYVIAIATFRAGLDPDNQSVPVITSSMDLFGVACILFVMTGLGVLPHG